MLKNKNGITLVALVITIIILLILAGISISSLTNNGLFGKAKDAEKAYNQAVKDEQTMLNFYELYIEGTLGKWTQDGNTLKKVNADGTITKIQIGDKVNYDEGTGHKSTINESFTTEDLEWRVLGINSQGQIELISTQPTSSKLTLSGEQD